MHLCIYARMFFVFLPSAPSLRNEPVSFYSRADGKWLEARAPAARAPYTYQASISIYIYIYIHMYTYV